MRYPIRTLLAIDTACGLALGLIRVVAYYPEVSVVVLLIAAFFGTYLFVSIALAYVIAWAISAFNSLIERLQDKELPRLF